MLCVCLVGTLGLAYSSPAAFAIPLHLGDLSIGEDRLLNSTSYYYLIPICFSLGLFTICVMYLGPPMLGAYMFIIVKSSWIIHPVS